VHPLLQERTEGRRIGQPKEKKVAPNASNLASSGFVMGLTVLKVLRLREFVARRAVAAAAWVVWAGGAQGQNLGQRRSVSGEKLSSCSVNSLRCNVATWSIETSISPSSYGVHEFNCNDSSYPEQSNGDERGSLASWRASELGSQLEKRAASPNLR